MGYSHYWERPRTLPQPAWDVFLPDVSQILDACGRRQIFIGDAMGDGGRPALTDHLVAFNGVKKGSCETFSIARVWDGRIEKGKMPFDFCKTNRSGYDLAVTSCLIAAHYRFENFIVRSDGSDVDWVEARMLCQQVLGFGENHRFVGTVGDDKRCLTDVSGVEDPL